MSTFPLSLAFLFLSISLTGQSIVGKVSDKNNNPVSEAVILNLSNASIFATTNDEGIFTINGTEKGDSLQVIHIGFYSLVHKIIDSKNPINISLESKAISLEEVVISRKSNPLQVLSEIDVSINPVNSSAEILRVIPGLFIGQHAGGGKAEQIFLRGFDIDHGTDIHLTVDGIPVNMVSHAHGQGYSDLHFLIPETIKNIDFGKGPYYEEKGNFNTAGYVNFKTKDFLTDSHVKLEVGQFNTQRILAMAKVINNERHQSYIASEYLRSDGPFESPQNLRRLNIFGKYKFQPSTSESIGVQASFFTSDWDASGQVPQRAIDSGLITRFGAIDDTEGGSTERINAMVNYRKIFRDKASFTNRFYYSNYKFDLFSNFTFFLDNPIEGDQIRQREKRNLFGFENKYTRTFEMTNFDVDWNVGTSLRIDRSRDNELSTSRLRVPRDTSRFGNIDEMNLGAFTSIKLYKNNFLVKGSVRLDYFDFNYQDLTLIGNPTLSNQEVIISPNLSVSYDLSNSIQFYAKYGKGFHSNDSRVVTSAIATNVLPAAHGFDIGNVWKPIPKVVINTAYWYLFLEQEFVYVGDAGIVEPSGKTRRNGFDLNMRYELFDWMFWKLDATYSIARSLEDQEGEDFIPLAPNFTLINGFDFSFENGVYGSMQLRHLYDRPANEDNSIIAEGYTLVDVNAGYRFKNLDFSLQVQNLFNSDWNEAQFATLSRLSFESMPTEEIHFTPGTPLFVKGVVSYSF